MALKGSNHTLSTIALSFIPTYAPLLYPHDAALHESHSVSHHHVRLLINSLTIPTIDKLGDQKERIRDAARKAIIQLAHAAYRVSSAQTASTSSSTSSTKGKEVETPLGIFERTLRDAGLASKIARVREQSLQLLPIIRQHCEKYPVRPLLHPMVDLLADADPTVREAAKATLIATFASAHPGAKAELKRELELKATRKQTMDAILQQVLAHPSSSLSASSTCTSIPPSHTIAPAGAAPAATATAVAVPQHTHPDQVPIACRGAVVGNQDIAPAYCASRGDLERTVTGFLPFFEGKETEHNWLNREKSVIKIRGMLKAGVHTHLGEPSFVASVRMVQEGILKALASLRTTVSMHAISLIAELASELGDHLAPCVEGLLSALMRMAGFTKKIVANATQEASGIIMVNVSFRHLYLQLIWQGIQEKNVAARTFAAEHLVTVLAAHAANRKHSIEGHGGLDMLQNCLKKGLADQNKDVRAHSRDAFWRFYRIWTSEGKVMLNALDSTLKKQVMTAAPPELDVDALVEVKPKMSSVPARRPGGASSAILAAKRAAAIRANQEKERLEREKAEQAAAAHEAKLAAAAAMAAAATPKAPRRGLPRLGASVSAASAAYAATPPSPAHIPLPTSPPASQSGLLDTPPRSRKTSSLSQHSSSNGSVSTPLSPEALGQRAISTSMSQGSSSLRQSALIPNRDHQDEDEDDDGDLTQQPTTDHGKDKHGPRMGSDDTDDGAADDTVQLPALTDVSVDLITFSSSPFKPGPAGGNGVGGRYDSPGDDSLALLETPQVASRKLELQAESPADTTISTPRRAVSGSAVQPLVPRTPPTTTTTATMGTPTSSGTKRSGLPRPVSMFHRGPSPLRMGGDGVGMTAKHRRGSQSVDLANENENKMVPVVSASGSGSAGSDKWFLSKAARLETWSSSPAKPISEAGAGAGEWVSALSAGRADVRAFRRLARLSSECDSGCSVWREEELFDRLWVALLSHIRSTRSGDMRMAGQILLHKLVQNQYGLVSGRETELLDVLTLTADRTGQAILQVWAEQVDPVLGLGALATRLPPSSLTLHALARLISRMPREIVPDQLGRAAKSLHAALNSEQTELRQEAVEVLVEAKKKCESHDSVLDALGEVDAQKRDLLMVSGSFLLLVTHRH